MTLSSQEYSASSQKGSGGVAVPVLDFVDAQPFGFQLVKTVGDVFVVFAHRLRQNVNGRILDVFGQVAFGNPVV